MTQFPLWKYLLVLSVLLIGILYALPNLFGEDYAIQVSGSRGAQVGQALEEDVRDALKAESIGHKAISLEQDRLLIRFEDADNQLLAADVLKERLRDNYVVALNLAPSTPGWLRALNASPMVLGLDLQGGVHFLMEVDMDAAVQQAQERIVEDIRNFLREDRIRYVSVAHRGGAVHVELRSEEDLREAQRVIEDNIQEVDIERRRGDDLVLVGTIASDQLEEIRSTALEQNLTIMRNRVNELGRAHHPAAGHGANRGPVARRAGHGRGQAHPGGHGHPGIPAGGRAERPAGGRRDGPRTAGLPPL